MRKSILAVSAALALGLASSAFAATFTTDNSGNSGSLQQGSVVQAGSVSAATTTGTGFAGTYGISNMSAFTTGKLISGASTAIVNGTTGVAGHSESGTLVEGAGLAGSIAGGNADAFANGEAAFNTGTTSVTCTFLIFGCGQPVDLNTEEGNASINAGSNGESWAATGSIGAGEGTSVQGFEASGDATAKSKIKLKGNGSYKAVSNVTTASGAQTYTLEEGNAIGETESLGFGFAGADVYRQHD